jgi:hypothetical protein
MSLNGCRAHLHGKRAIESLKSMPSLFRFLSVVAIIVGVIYGGIYALANFVQPKPREMTINVPPDKFLKN